MKHQPDRRQQNSPRLAVEASGGPGASPNSENAPWTNRGRHRLYATGRFMAFCVAVGLVVVAVSSVGVAVTDDHASTAAAGTTSTTTTGTSQGPAGKPTSLPALLVQPRDTRALSIHLLPGGDQVKGQATLDLCNQTFPSESLRIQRLQDVAIDTSGAAILSTEAVLYRNAAATRQAFTELRRVRASCPKGPVTNPDGSTITTIFHPTPDTTWPRTASVEREAFNLTTTDAKGASADSLAVYLRRGRVLLGIYFSKPNGQQPAIDGRTTPADIMNAFATRIAQLPASFVADPAR
jgi:hypothetical protein